MSGCSTILGSPAGFGEHAARRPEPQRARIGPVAIGFYGGDHHGYTDYPTLDG
ncbi:hypothetical protein [Sciscionella marina]|uniref:hypothetical protein n=1 Tax=Sciscionella marina TaxID=508770 RepID=UPI0003728446|nr:hypothetical protein [Sciscionella marina]